MKELSKTQKEVLNKIIRDIERAKSHTTYEDYVKANYNGERKYFIDNELENQNYKQYWLDELQNITLTHCSSSTLKALENKGFIEIIKDAGVGIDTVRLLK